MNLDQVLRADLAALADRSAQEARKWLERSHLASWGGAELVPGGAMPAEIVRAAQALRAARAATRPDARFFAGPLEDIGAQVSAAFPGELGRALRVHEQSRAGRFDLLGYRDLSFGLPIDWHLDPVSDTRAPLLHWSLIRGLDRAQVGDSKVIWELSRCQWWVTLARAFAMDPGRDPALPAAIAAHARSWRAANPPATGVNWASSLEAALRLIAWSWTAFLLRSSGALPAPELEALLLDIREHARHVARYLSRHYSPNTHLTGEALGLFYAGVALPELREAEAWRAAGAAILVEQLGVQVHADGVYFEQAACYQRYTIEIYLHFLILARQSGWAVPESVARGVIGMLDFLLAARRPDGSLPPIGDADGGWLLPLTERGPGDLRGIFSTAAALFHRADYAWAAGDLAPETLWLLGEEGARAFRELVPREPASPASRLFPDGGAAVMSSGWDARAHQLVFDVGPLGAKPSGGHGHADLLSIQCSIFGEPAIVDPGTFSYADPIFRDYFRGTSAHSALTVDGEEQAGCAGPFRWTRLPRARLDGWASGPALDHATASHDAYLRLADPVRHRRQVLFVDRRYWVVIDDLDGADAGRQVPLHRVDLRFQLAPMAASREGLAAAEWVRARTPGGHALLVRAFSGTPLSLSIHEGELSPPRGWVSPDYGQRSPAPLLVYSASAKLPLRIATLLFPLEDSEGAAPQVEAVPSVLGPIGLRFAGATQIAPADFP